MGVTAVVLSKKNCSSITPVVAKAASGAAELLPILHTESTISFVKQSQKNGWLCIATVSPNDKLGNKSIAKVSALRALHASGPMMLLFGSEAKGLRTMVKRECKKVTTVPAAPDVSPLVDSLNIGTSVAAVLSAIMLT